MERLVVTVPFTRVILTGILLGIGMVIGVKISSALLKIATPRFGKFQKWRKF
jgi:hypothetical protein